MYSLNVGAFCIALESTLSRPVWRPHIGFGTDEEESGPVPQPDVVTAVLLLPYHDKVLEDEGTNLPDISGTYASRCVHNISKVKKEIRVYVRTVDLGVIQRNLETRILDRMTPKQFQLFLESIKALVRGLPPDEDYTKLHSYLDQYAPDTGVYTPLNSRFLSKCVQFCLLMPNTPKERPKWSWLNRAPDKKKYDDPYRLVSDDPGSSAIRILFQDVRGFQSPKEFRRFDLLIEQIVRQNLIVKGIDCTDGIIRVFYDHFPESGYRLRKLKAADTLTAAQFIREHEDDFQIKRGWRGRPLSEMVLNGLKKRIWTAYGYFSPDGKLIAYLDAKTRVDGSVECGVALTENKYRGMQLASSLINFFKLLFAHARLFGGTYEKNIFMRKTFDSTGFKQILYYDKDADRMVKLIPERINPDYPTDESKDFNSVYYFSESLITTAFRTKLRVKEGPKKK